MPTRAANLHLHDVLEPALCDVLIVEDDVVLGELMASFLTRQGLAVKTAHSGQSALRLLERVRPRVVIVDYCLPGENGLGVAQTLRERCGRLPIILMSGTIDRIEGTLLEAAGIRIFVNKPVPLTALHRAVHELMGDGSCTSRWRRS